jgi:uncharacterized protein
MKARPMPDPFQDYSVLLLPCRDNAAPSHWMSHWQRAFPGLVRVEQDDWTNPTYADWAARLDQSVAAAPRPVILIAHSLGTSLIMRWAAGPLAKQVAGAFMVAPSDRGPADIWPDAGRNGFAPMVLDPLPFPALVLAARNDPYVAFDRAREFAAAWGAGLIDMGEAGHMGNSADLGLWPEGLLHLGGFLQQVRSSRR